MENAEKAAETTCVNAKWSCDGENGRSICAIGHNSLKIPPIFLMFCKLSDDIIIYYIVNKLRSFIHFETIYGSYREDIVVVTNRTVTFFKTLKTLSVFAYS